MMRTFLAAALTVGAISLQTIRTDVDVVSTYFTVRDSHNRLDSKLEKADFRVFEDGKEQSIKFFAHHTDVPLNIGVLLDTSTSITPLLQTEADAAGYFLRNVMRPADQGFAVSYNARVESLQLPTDDVEQLAKKIETIVR